MQAMGVSGAPRFCAQPRVSGARIGLQVLLVQGAHVGHDRLEIVVSPLESRRGAVEEFRGKGMVSFARKAFRNVADVRVHAEGFLKHQKPGARAAVLRLRHVRAHGGSVRNLQSDPVRSDFCHGFSFLHSNTQASCDFSRKPSQFPTPQCRVLREVIWRDHTLIGTAGCLPQHLFRVGDLAVEFRPPVADIRIVDFRKIHIADQHGREICL